MAELTQIANVNNSIFSLDVSPRKETLALLCQIESGANLKICLIDNLSQIVLNHLLKGELNSKNLVRYIDGQNNLICFFDRELLLINEKIVEITEIATDVETIYIDRERRWVIGVLHNNGNLQAVRWNTQDWENPNTISLNQFSGFKTDSIGSFLYQKGCKGAIMLDSQLVTLDWEEGTYSCQPFEDAEIYWTDLSLGENLLALIGSNLQGTKLYEWPSLNRVLSEIFSDQMQGYTRFIFHPSSELLAISSRIGYIAILRSKDGQRLFSQQVHTGRVRDLVFNVNECEDNLFSCGDDGRVYVLSLSDCDLSKTIF